MTTQAENKDIYVRCTSCNKMLGIVHGYYKIIVPILNASCRTDKILFTTKCPRCSEMNQIEFKK